MTDTPKRSGATTLSYVATAIGMCLWAAHMILKYAMNQPRQFLLWIAIAFIILGFVIRRATR